MDVINAFKRPFSDVKKLIIGCVLNIIPIVNFLSIGFIGESAKFSFKKRKELPEWKNWGDLFITGFFMFLIGFVYSLPGLIILFLSLGSTITNIFSGSSPAGIMSSLIFAGPLIVLSLLLLLASFYISPAAIMGYLSKGKLGDAFKCKIVLKKAFTGNYLGAWFLALVFGLLFGLVLGWIPIVGKAIASFISGVIGLTLLAESYK